MEMDSFGCWLLLVAAFFADLSRHISAEQRRGGAYLLWLWGHKQLQIAPLCVFVCKYPMYVPIHQTQPFPIQKGRVYLLLLLLSLARLEALYIVDE